MPRSRRKIRLHSRSFGILIFLRKRLTNIKKCANIVIRYQLILYLFTQGESRVSESEYRQKIAAFLAHAQENAEIIFSVDPEERQKNKDFLLKFNIKERDRISIIKELTTEDFCEEIFERIKDRSVFGNLYVFKKDKVLQERQTNDKRLVSIYIKLQLFNMRDGKATFVVSFHEAEKQMKLFFKTR